VLVDLRRIELPVASTAALEAGLGHYPRLGIDQVLPELVVAQALEGSDATKAPPFSWPGALVAAHRARSEDARRSVAGGRPRSATDSTARGSDI